MNSVLKKRLAMGVLFVTFIACPIAILLPAGNRSALGTQVFQGQTLDTWFDQLQGHNEDPVIDVLRDFGPEAVAYLNQQIRKKDSFLRQSFASAWPKLPAFLKSKLKQPKTAAAGRIKAISALRQLGRPFTNSIRGQDALINALKHSDFGVRSRAEGALGDLGPEAAAAVPALMTSIRQRRATVTGHMNINGIWALGRIGPNANAAIPLLESIIKETNGRELVYAAAALINMGGDVPTAKAALEKALNDTNSQARAEAKLELKRLSNRAD